MNDAFWSPVEREKIKSSLFEPTEAPRRLQADHGGVAVKDQAARAGDAAAKHRARAVERVARPVDVVLEQISAHCGSGVGAAQAGRRSRTISGINRRPNKVVGERVLEGVRRQWVGEATHERDQEHAQHRRKRCSHQGKTGHFCGAAITR